MWLPFTTSWMSCSDFVQASVKACEDGLPLRFVELLIGLTALKSSSGRCEEVALQQVGGL